MRHGELKKAVGAEERVVRSTSSCRIVQLVWLSVDLEPEYRDELAFI